MVKWYSLCSKYVDYCIAVNYVASSIWKQWSFLHAVKSKPVLLCHQNMIHVLEFCNSFVVESKRFPYHCPVVMGIHWSAVHILGKRNIDVFSVSQSEGDLKHHNAHVVVLQYGRYRVNGIIILCIDFLQSCYCCNQWRSHNNNTFLLFRYLTINLNIITNKLYTAITRGLMRQKRFLGHGD